MKTTAKRRPQLVSVVKVNAGWALVLCERWWLFNDEPDMKTAQRMASKLRRDIRRAVKQR